MEQWTVQQRVFTYDAYTRNGDSVVGAQREFRRHFNIGRHGGVPGRKTILKWVRQFRGTGNLAPKHPPGPQRTQRTPENIERVQRAVITSPRRSVRRHSQALHIPRETVRRILKRDLRFHPYKIVTVQQLLPGDWAQREDFAVRMQVILSDEPDAVVFMSDEAHFHLSGFVNQQNFRYWAPTNPNQLHERPLHSSRVTVWCALSRRCIIGPYFVEENGVTVTVNADRYMHLINTFFLPELQRMELDEGVWFQQDGATAHTARRSMNLLQDLFPGHLISRFGDVPWPPRSPDLNACDFFLWGYLKEKVYTDKPRTLQDLKAAIQREVRQITQETLERVWNSFTERLEICIREDGHHLEDVIFAM